MTTHYQLYHIFQAAKRKENDALHEWVSAVHNNFWHCAESCGGDEETLRVIIKFCITAIFIVYIHNLYH